MNCFAILLHMDCSADLNNFVVQQDFFLSDFNHSLMVLKQFLSVLCNTLQVLQIIFNKKSYIW